MAKSPQQAIQNLIAQLASLPGRLAIALKQNIPTIPQAAPGGVNAPPLPQRLGSQTLGLQHEPGGGVSGQTQFGQFGQAFSELGALSPKLARFGQELQKIETVLRGLERLRNLMGPAWVQKIPQPPTLKAVKPLVARRAPSPPAPKGAARPQQTPSPPGAGPRPTPRPAVQRQQQPQRAQPPIPAVSPAQSPKLPAPAVPQGRQAPYAQTPAVPQALPRPTPSTVPSPPSGASARVLPLPQPALASAGPGSLAGSGQAALMTLLMDALGDLKESIDRLRTAQERQRPNELPRETHGSPGQGSGRGGRLPSQSLPSGMPKGKQNVHETLQYGELLGNVLGKGGGAEAAGAAIPPVV